MTETQKTPAAKWRQDGDVDPHGDRYNCQRATLTLGEYTDDELANGVFLHGNEPLNINALLRKTPGYHSAIVWLTAAKDRIRWLSRTLEESAAREHALQLRLNAADQRVDSLESGIKWESERNALLLASLTEAEDMLSVTSLEAGQRLTAAEQRNANLLHTLRSALQGVKMVGRPDHLCDYALAGNIQAEIEAALFHQPTESGASE